MDVFLEEAAILTGSRRGRVWLTRRCHPAQGAPMSVEADWRWALRREERYGDVIGFYHTHPFTAGASPSERDVRTMRAWCGAFGKPMLCVIACGTQAQTTLFANDEDEGQVLTITECFAGGLIVAVEEIAEET
ncbi:MAG TPA: Mov34/MPN/PAD-1 family protein [Ktedonobacterales bacterium]|jgi:proteasome lid subunit RPN8/RPN11